MKCSSILQCQPWKYSLDLFDILQKLDIVWFQFNAFCGHHVFFVAASSNLNSFPVRYHSFNLKPILECVCFFQICDRFPSCLLLPCQQTFWQICRECFLYICLKVLPHGNNKYEGLFSKIFEWLTNRPHSQTGCYLELE